MLMPKKLKDLSRGDYKRILERSRSRMEEILSRVIPIIQEVEKHGDEAVSSYTSEFDGVSLSSVDFLVKKGVASGVEMVYINRPHAGVAQW